MPSKTAPGKVRVQLDVRVETRRTLRELAARFDLTMAVVVDALAWRELTLYEDGEAITFAEAVEAVTSPPAPHPARPMHA